MATLTYRDALNQALREEMQRDPNVFLMGEEVGVYQGAYKVSRGLLEEFGPMRIVDTPIAELGFAGIGVGAAMAGLRPVIEFMTWNFAVLALDQIINSAAKVLYESGGQIPIPIVFRGPNGAALQLAAQHSQAWDAWVSHIPGLKVVAPATPADAKGLLKAAIRDNNPVIVLEGEMLYNVKGEVPEGEHIVPIGQADVKRPGRDVTFICHSKTVAVALKAAEQMAEHEGVSAEVLDLRAPRPLPRLIAVATNVYMEALSPTMEEGRVVKWHKRDGDPVKAGETLAEVETDKAVMDLVARADGVLRQVAAAEGQTVAVGSVVAVIASPGETVGATVAAAPPPAPVPSRSGMRDAGGVEPAPADVTRVKASPLAKRMAREAGVDLKLVSGSGPGGRVFKRDVEGSASRALAPAAATPVVQSHPASRIPHPEATGAPFEDRKSTRLNSSHGYISYAVFCLKKKKNV